MYSIEVNWSGPRWYVRAGGRAFAWTDEAARARLFDTSAAASDWLKQRGHSGIGTRIRLLAVVH